MVSKATHPSTWSSGSSPEVNMRHARGPEATKAPIVTSMYITASHSTALCNKLNQEPRSRWQSTPVILTISHQTYPEAVFPANRAEPRALSPGLIVSSSSPRTVIQSHLPVCPLAPGSGCA